VILGYHFILTAYGFWLPNDPRGSWSAAVRRLDLLAFGPATKVDTTRSLAADPHDTAARLAARAALKHPPVRFTGPQANAVANGFALAAAEADYKVHALAILPDHAHLVIARHAKPIARIAAHLKARATQQLNQQDLHPLAGCASGAGRVPTPWSRSFWCPFIDDTEHMRRAIRYVEQNPVKAGLRPQRWKQVVPYRG